MIFLENYSHYHTGKCVCARVYYMHLNTDFYFFFADGESGMEDETRSVSGFLHFDTVSKGLCHETTF